MGTQTLRAVTATHCAGGRTTTSRRCKRLRRPYHALFEGLVTTSRGDKIDGTAYRNGKLTGDAVCYQFHRRNGPANPENRVRGSHTLAALVKKRLAALLPAPDIDLLYLRFVAGWSQADLARGRGCHRSTIKRREHCLLQILRADPLLRRAAGASV